MKMFANLSRFIYHSEPPQPSAAPFDDGLTEIARLIAREDPIKAAALPAATTIATERGPRAGVVMPPSMFAATDEVIEGVESLPELAQQDQPFADLTSASGLGPTSICPTYWAQMALIFNAFTSKPKVAFEAGYGSRRMMISCEIWQRSA